MKILLVDESPAELLLLQDMLNIAGFSEHKGFVDLSLAPQMAAAYHPDLIVLALEANGGVSKANNAGDEASFELLRQLNASISPIEYRPILAVSRSTDTHFKREILKRGATDFLAKPLDFTDTLLRIKNLLHTRQMHCEWAFAAHLR